MKTKLRVLDNADAPALERLCEQHIVEDIFVAARVRTLGLSARALGCPVLGYFRDGSLRAAFHAGNNLVQVGDDPDAVAEFVERIGARHATQSIMGRADLVARLQAALAARWGDSWAHYREFRSAQPVMLIDHEPTVATDERVRLIANSESDAYFRASVAMYTEEVGVSPLEQSNGYHFHIRQLIRSNRAFGAVDGGHVWFKTDIGASYGSLCQVQGVWLAPELRGQGRSEAAFAQVVKLIRQQYPQVSLYVNDFNTRAVRMYCAIGMRVVGQLATVLY